MNKKCINAKNYKLTVGKEYEILHTDDEGYFTLVNDNNKGVRYSSDLFEVDEAHVPVQPARTEQDCINSLEITINNSVLTVKFIDLNNEVVQFTNSFSIQETDMSCGIRMINGISGFFDNVESFVNTEDDDMLSLKKEILKQSITRINNYCPHAGMILYSTNQKDEFEDYTNWLDEIATSNTGWNMNPNSGNFINMWTFVK